MVHVLSVYYGSGQFKGLQMADLTFSATEDQRRTLTRFFSLIRRQVVIEKVVFEKAEVLIELNRDGEQLLRCRFVIE